MPAKEGGIVPFSLLKLRSLHGQLKHSALQYIVILQSLQTCLQMFKICPVANVRWDASTDGTFPKYPGFQKKNCIT